MKGKSSKIGRARQFLTVITENGEQTNQYNCNLCGVKLSGNCQSNLLNHFKARHKLEFKNVINVTPDESTAVQRLKLVLHCVELVAINSQPFSLLSCSGFRGAVQKQLNEFKLAGCNLDLSDHHVNENKDKVIEVAMNIKQQVKAEMEGKIISLMVDGATRNGRSIFGINAQYKIGGRLKLVTLSMKELNEAHTAEYLSSILLQVLGEFEIDLSQVISITTDNGSNMLAMVKDLENKLFGATDHQEVENDPNEGIAVQSSNDRETQTNDEETEKEIQDVLNEDELTDDDALKMLFDSSTMYEELLEKLVSDMRKRSGNHQSPCCAHSATCCQ